MKTLQKIFCVGVGILSVGAGCSNHNQYNYNGKIGEEQVEFKEEINPGNYNILRVTKLDGRIIEYRDVFGDDLKLDSIRINENEKIIKYFDDEVGSPILEEGQKQFDAYLKRILEIKIKEGLDSLK